MRKLLCIQVFLLCTMATGKMSGQSLHVVFPGKAWEKTGLEQLGWSPAKIEKARKYFETLPAGNVIAVDRGHIVAEWGD